MSIEKLGIDIAKNVFQLHGVNRNGRVILKRRVMRDQFLQVIAQTESCTIAIEACTGAFYWQRQFEALGHQVRIISLQYVNPASISPNTKSTTRLDSALLMLPLFTTFSMNAGLLMVWNSFSFIEPKRSL